MMKIRKTRAAKLKSPGIASIQMKIKYEFCLTNVLCNRACMKLILAVSRVTIVCKIHNYNRYYQVMIRCREEASLYRKHSAGLSLLIISL